jgi:uncharacterized protein (DUF433 family)
MLAARCRAESGCRYIKKRITDWGGELVAMFNRVTCDPAILGGQPCIRGMRLTVRRVLEALATYHDRNELRAEYPELEDEDIRQALEYAAANLDDKVVELPSAV